MHNLQAAREIRGVTQKAVADYIGVTRQTYARYEAEQERMTIEQAKAVCEFLHCSITDIFLPEEVK